MTRSSGPPLFRRYSTRAEKPLSLFVQGAANSQTCWTITLLYRNQSLSCLLSVWRKWETPTNKVG
jgi:hypothetical protein